MFFFTTVNVLKAGLLAVDALSVMVVAVLRSTQRVVGVVGVKRAPTVGHHLLPRC